MYTFSRLQKSERTLSNKKLHKTSRHSEVKRAHRRIKDAVKMIKDGPRPDNVDTMFEAMAEQVTRLCQQLMQVPMIFSVHTNVSGSPTAKSPAFIDNSDHSDSDSSEKDTNVSNSNVRPRANSDSRIESTVNSKRRGMSIMDASRLKHHESGTEHDNRPRNDSDSYQNKWYTDRFEAIGYFPNDSESSDGSFRGESPGPLRGFPLSVQRRPASAGRIERHKLSRGRSSSLPLLNGRRCTTPTLSSNGTLTSRNGQQMTTRHIAVNGITNMSTKSSICNRKENILPDLHRKYNLDSTTGSNTRFAQDRSIVEAFSKTDEILTSYQRKVEHLVKGNPQAKTQIKDNASSSEGSDSREYSNILDDASFRKESETSATFVECQNVKCDKIEYGLNHASLRLTPKRLLPKVPSTKIKTNSNNSDSENIPANQNTGYQFAMHHGSHLRTTREESKPKCSTKASLDNIIVQEDDARPCSNQDEYSTKTAETKSLFEQTINNADGNLNSHDFAQDKLRKDYSVRDKAEESILNRDAELKLHVKDNKTNSFDIEEIKFKENVRTARREIIDKLRSKYALPLHEKDQRVEETKADQLVEEPKADVKHKSNADNSKVLHTEDTKNIDTNESKSGMQRRTGKTDTLTNSTMKPDPNAIRVKTDNTTERHSPVMSIAGLKRYKSTTNLSKLESFDNASSKFDNAADEKDVKYRQEMNVTKFEETDNAVKLLQESGRNDDSSDFSTGSNETNNYAKTDKLSQSLTYERKGPILSLPPIDRQGLLRSASVENVDTYQFLANFGSEGSIGAESSNLKESGISTMSFNDSSLKESQTLKANDDDESSGSVETGERVAVPVSSSDNGFDSNEGLCNSEESLDNLNSDRIDDAYAIRHQDARSPHTYPAKLVVIDKHNHGARAKSEHITKTVSNKPPQGLRKSTETEMKSYGKPIQSSVKNAIDKLENAIFSRSRPEKRTLKQFKEESMDKKIHVRSRSASASRCPALVGIDSSPLSSQALRPRGRFGSASEASETKSPFFSSVKKSRSIEADLNKICQEETAESIRREWIQRRSASGKEIPKQTTAETPRSVFKFSEAILLLSRYLRSHISGIISLQNGRIVLVDELQMSLFFLTSDFRILHETTLEYMPSGICVTGSNLFAVAFPYKSLIRVFYVVKDRVTHTREITVKCTEWITDIRQSKGRVHALCKAGHIHILGITGREEGIIDVGLTGKLLINEAGNRFYIHGERKITRCNDKGEVIWTKSDTNASCVMLYNDKLYIADNEKKKIMAMSEIGDTRDLVSNVNGPISAVCFTHDDQALYVCQYSDDMDDESTRRIGVYRKQLSTIKISQ